MQLAPAHRDLRPQILRALHPRLAEQRGLSRHATSAQAHIGLTQTERGRPCAPTPRIAAPPSANPA
jgi:hypothetical protein